MCGHLRPRGGRDAAGRRSRGRAPAEPTRSTEPADGASTPPSEDAAPSDAAPDAASGGTGGTDSADRSKGAGAAHGPADGTEPSRTPSDTPSSGAPDASDPAGPADSTGGTGGKHRGAPAPEEGRNANGGVERESGRHASRGDDDARDAGASAADGTYTVRSGDNLWAIADAQKVPGGWPALYEANKDAVGTDPDLILPGQSLDLDVKAE